jgi:hypothetical protein
MEKKSCPVLSYIFCDSGKVVKCHVNGSISQLSAGILGRVMEEKIDPGIETEPLMESSQPCPIKVNF